MYITESMTQKHKYISKLEVTVVPESGCRHLNPIFRTQTRTHTHQKNIYI